MAEKNMKKSNLLFDKDSHRYFIDKQELLKSIEEV